jgi:nitrogenase molybdenum-iron protein alpha/beta subunit
VRLRARGHRYGVPYFETSAKTGLNVEATFMELARMTLANKGIALDERRDVRLGARDRARKKKACC